MSLVSFEHTCKCTLSAKAAGVGLAVLLALLTSSIACYRMQKNSKAAADIEYPAYGISGPNKDLCHPLATGAWHSPLKCIVTNTGNNAMVTNSSVKGTR